MKDILSRFMNAYWLRPETAMWRTLDVVSMQEFEFKSPSLDLGCGDGTYSFLRAGGQFDDSFDVFSVDNLDLFFENYDVYDAEANNAIQIKKKADYKIDIGLDHKSTLLKKAGKLGLYKSFIVADANERLPFEDESFTTIFSNIVYWLNNPAKVFSEICRILKPDGKCCVMLPGPQYIESSFYYRLYIKEQRKEFDFLELLDRGRIQDNLKTVKSYMDWVKIIENSGGGLKVEKVIPHLSATLISIWDIGMRPIFPILKKMTDEIPQEKKAGLKQEWIKTLEQVALPIIENDDKLTQGKEYCFYCFILSRR